ncbi:uncharacterized protein At4g22758-like [Macadamia integrifolia]|uniref:uncharacterized protein At4g22758-like n=1 Tax=Macadamia integrifolia TaxID=60698 RepID=UPI001C4EE868|nr:uncharacterized protein At4g22758-like [Macadamia integrifolia]XP_042500317.1 uncharacterized protein At4g22758-like [Macadamia integrifolia]
MLLQKPKKNNQSVKGKRLLITINVLGSAGPLRFVVNEEELVAAVIDTALKSYAREGRLPVLGSDLNNFLLYCANAGADALSPWETIGSGGGRNFVLYKKPQHQPTESVGGEKPTPTQMIARKGNGGWKSWINKSLSLKIYSH